MLHGSMRSSKSYPEFFEMTVTFNQKPTERLGAAVSPCMWDIGVRFQDRPLSGGTTE